MWNFQFFISSILLGVALAMDAFSVSVANGINEPLMKKRKMVTIAGVFGLFQAFMPMLGWLFVHSLVQVFSVLDVVIPYLALALLTFIGVKMIIDGTKCDGEEAVKTGAWAFIVQGIATSIDALSVGLTIADYNFLMALICSLIIMSVTFIICFAGVFIGKRFGKWCSNKACIFGGAILILVGLEIFITSFI